MQQRLHRSRERAIAIHPIGGQLQQTLAAVAVSSSAIGSHFLVGFGDPIGGDEGGHAQIDLGVIHRRDVLTANLGKLLLEHFHVEVETDGFHLAALLHPQQIANAADFHVPHGELVAAAELGKFLDCPQPLPCGITEAGVSGIEEPGVGLDATAAHTAPQLVEL